MLHGSGFKQYTCCRWLKQKAPKIGALKSLVTHYRCMVVVTVMFFVVFFVMDLSACRVEGESCDH